MARPCLLSALLASFLVGCSTSHYYQPGGTAVPSSTAPPARPLSYVYPENPPIGNADTLSEILRGYQRRGMVVLVDFWSVSSRASRDRFGALIDLRAKYRENGLQCLSVSFDNPGRWKPEIAPFLRSVRCSYPCVLVRPHDRTGVVTHFSNEWNGGTPAALLFDRDGMLAAEFLGVTPTSGIHEKISQVIKGEHKPIGRPGQLMSARSNAQARMLDLLDGKTIGRSQSQWSSADDIEAVAKRIADGSESGIDWTRAKVAILPFTIVGKPAKPGTGKLLADAVARILEARHPDAVVDRERADAVLAQNKLTGLAVEYDPTVLAGKAGWTHIITGTIRLK